MNTASPSIISDTGWGRYPVAEQNPFAGIEDKEQHRSCSTGASSLSRQSHTRAVFPPHQSRWPASAAGRGRLRFPPSQSPHSSNLSMTNDMDGRAGPVENASLAGPADSQLAPFLDALCISTAIAASTIWLTFGLSQISTRPGWFIASLCVIAWIWFLAAFVWIATRPVGRSRFTKSDAASPKHTHSPASASSLAKVSGAVVGRSVGINILRLNANQHGVTENLGVQQYPG